MGKGSSLQVGRAVCQVYTVCQALSLDTAMNRSEKIPTLRELMF